MNRELSSKAVATLLWLQPTIILPFHVIHISLNWSSSYEAQLAALRDRQVVLPCRQSI